MRMLQSSGELDDEDLEAVYAYPAAQTWVRLPVVAGLDGGTAEPTGAELQPPVPLPLASTLTDGDQLLLRYLGGDPATSKER